MLENFVRSGPVPPLTVALMAVSVILSLAAGLGSSLQVYAPFLIDLPGSGGLESGEYWRLLTPIFIHFGVLHLLFNMLWLWDLGGAVESRRGLWYFAGFVVVSGIGGNLVDRPAPGLSRQHRQSLPGRATARAPLIESCCF